MLRLQRPRVRDQLLGRADLALAGPGVRIAEEQVAREVHRVADAAAEQVAHRFGRIGTIDLRTDFLHQGIGREFTATGTITRLGGRIASVQMRLENESQLLIATAAAAYVVS